MTLLQAALLSNVPAGSCTRREGSVYAPVSGERVVRLTIKTGVGILGRARVRICFANNMPKYPLRA